MTSSNNDKSNNSEITLKEASSKLDLSETTVKRYLKDFDLEIIKGHGSKTIITKETFQALSEIAKLRANGLSIQEIKELKKQEPSKHILDQIEETQEFKKEEVDELLDNQEAPASDMGKDLELIQQTQEEKELQDKSLDEEQEDERPRRRRGFNYRYVERQIANDSKKVSILKRRLQNPHISIQDKLLFEEALERRILFLNGWRHILRWVSKQ